MYTNNSYAKKTCKLHERDTKYTGYSEQREVTIIYGNRENCQ